MDKNKEDLKKKLEGLHISLRREMKKKWKRSLPFEEEIFNRWERAKFLGFGDKTSVYQLSYIFGDVKVGKNTWIGPFTVLDGSGGLEIGDNCSIASGVHIYTHNTVKWAISGGKENYEYQKTIIGDCCFIGAKSVINMGVSIGEHSVVGVGSFINKDVPPYSIIVGNPSKVVGKVNLQRNKVELKYFNHNENNNRRKEK